MRLNRLSYPLILMGSMMFSVQSVASMHENNMPGVVNGSVPTEETMTNEDLKSQVSQMLDVYSDKVNVLVVENTVYLSGELPSDTDYEKVVVMVESLKGTHKINVDNLKVKDSQQPLSDTYTTAKIKGKLIKEDILDKDIPSWSIGVETKNGIVFLSGKVKSDQEKLQVLEVVRSIKDIKGINDQLEVME